MPPVEEALAGTSAADGLAAARLTVVLRGRAVLDEVSVCCRRGGAAGVVGESGAGKSTLVRALAGLITPIRGVVTIDGRPIARRDRRRVQVVFQDPYASLNPRHSVRRILGQPLWVHRRLRGSEATTAAAGLLADVGLPPEVLPRHPDAFSGGQRQRIALARALSVDPSFLLLDEPLCALDATTAEALLALLSQLRGSRDVGCLLVSHDLDAMRGFAEQVYVLRGGAVVEHGAVDKVLTAPQHAYTRALVDAAGGAGA